MARRADFVPDWASPPGATIADLVRERGISERDLAVNLGQTLAELRNLLDGRVPITLGLAQGLQETLGASVEFWMTRDHHYRVDAQRIHASKQRDWVSALPVRDMIGLGWIEERPRPEEEANACLQFFGVPTIRAWHETYLESPSLAAFRISPSLDSRPGAVAAWIRQATIVATATECAAWDPKSFSDSLANIRRLTRIADPTRFLPPLREICAASGIAVVVLRTPAGCPASGAARLLSPNRGLIVLSFRHRSDDHVWFTFFHEAGHLVLHGEQGLHIDGDPTPSTPVEQEANDFAAEILIPNRFRTELESVPLRPKDIIRLARSVGVSPGILVGQLQHSGRIGYDRLNSLKRRYEQKLY